jgi:hypothetical protein
MILIKVYFFFCFMHRSEAYELHPDGNSFDMSQNFIAAKRI